MGIGGVVRNDHIGFTTDLWPEKIVDAKYEYIMEEREVKHNSKIFD